MRVICKRWIVYAFISYQTDDKAIAGKIKYLLTNVGVSSFMAHEDIDVSEEWRLKILEEIGKADLFVSVLSRKYDESLWCIQEAGIASFRKEMTKIPLSIDGSIPKAFAGNIQSIKIDIKNIQLQDILPGILKADFETGIEIIFKLIEGSGSFRGAEANFQQLLPYIDSLSPKQGKKILEIAINNDQVHYASLCVSEYIPPIMIKYGSLLSC